MREQEKPIEAPQPLEVNFAALPQQLQTQPHWVVWNYRLIDGEYKKPPCDPRTGRLASVRDATTWGSFQEAHTAYSSGAFSGIGFVLSKDIGIVGIDIDHCIADRRIATSARQIIQALNSYSEVSPSGTGIRILLTGSLPGTRRRQGSIEMYDDLRYLTLTGHLLKTTPKTLQSRQRELYSVYQRLFAAEPNQLEKENTGEGVKREPPAYPLRRTDQEVLEKALTARNGDTFRRYYIGDTSLWEGADARHASQSEADFTLVLMLLYWTNHDTSQVDRLFRQSGLMRQKWTRPLHGSETYGDRLIQDALRNGKH
jgi:putative DNA primase/helicase